MEGRRVSRRSVESFGTIAISKGIPAFRRSPFFHEIGPSGSNVARRAGALFLLANNCLFLLSIFRLGPSPHFSSHR